MGKNDKKSKPVQLRCGGVAPLPLLPSYFLPSCVPSLALPIAESEPLYLPAPCTPWLPFMPAQWLPP